MRSPALKVRLEVKPASKYQTKQRQRAAETSVGAALLYALSRQSMAALPVSEEARHVH